MNVSLILGHPRQDSFCRAIADAAAATLSLNGHLVTFHDLYAEGFNPLVSADESRTRVSSDALVEQHCVEIAKADGLVVVHPNWWGQPPAILTGWIDRVIRPGVAYDLAVGATGARTTHVGRLRVRTAVVFNTSDSPLTVEQGRFGNTLDVIWRTYVADLCGIPNMRRILFSVMGTSSPEQRAAWLNDVRAAIQQDFPKA
jgi:putative NADPH-quinone reductase